MPRRKPAQHCTILPWLSRRRDNTEGRFIQVGNSLLLSKKDRDGEETNPYVRLSAGAKYLYLCMAMEAAGQRSFEFTRVTAEKYGICNSNLRRNVAELIEAGFIKCNSGKNVRLPNEYEFCFDWKPV